MSSRPPIANIYPTMFQVNPECWVSLEQKDGKPDYMIALDRHHRRWRVKHRDDLRWRKEKHLTPGGAVEAIRKDQATLQQSLF